MTDTAGKWILGSTDARDIFKDGASGPCTAQMWLIDLREAITPPACEECGHREERSAGSVEHCLEEVAQAIWSMEPAHQGEWVQKLFKLLWDTCGGLEEEWVEGLRQCPRMGWAGMALLEMRAGLVMEAWSTLHLALMGGPDDGTD